MKNRVLFVSVLVNFMLLSLIILPQCRAGEKDELLLKQRAIQAEMAAIETSFRLLPYQFKEKQEELTKVQQQLQTIEAAEKKAAEKPVEKPVEKKK